MDKTQSFKELLVWQKAHQYVLQVYRLTGSFPKSEIYGLSSQFRRAAVSIAANIAEAYRKRGLKGKMHLLNIAHSSLEECRYYNILTIDLKYHDDSSLDNLLTEVGKLLTAYSNKILINSNLPPSY